MPITIPYSPIEGELWKSIPGYDGRYEASSEGRIRSVKGKRCKNGKVNILRTYIASQYTRTAVMENGKIHQIGVHQLVAAAFLGPCPDGLEIDHVDLNKQNNRPDNLEYVTHLENLRRAHASGNWNTARGERSGNAKLTEEQVAEIRASSLSQRNLATMYGVSQPLICYIKSGKQWKHVED